MLASLLALVITGVSINEQMTIYPIVDTQANLGWKVDLFELSMPTGLHYHEVQRQIIINVEGQLKTYNGSEEPSILNAGEFAIIEPGSVHSLEPIGTSWFFAIDVPGFDFPNDTYFTDSFNASSAKKYYPPHSSELPPLDFSFIKKSIKLEGYTLHELLSEESTLGKCRLNLLEIESDSIAFHQESKGMLIVVNGQLDITIKGQSKKLGAGEMLAAEPGSTYLLNASGASSVRVLSFSFF